jgi:hypothetical protein
VEFLLYGRDGTAGERPVDVEAAVAEGVALG